jgi:hypothetical protein
VDSLSYSCLEIMDRKGSNAQVSPIVENPFQSGAEVLTEQLVRAQGQYSRTYRSRAHCRISGSTKRADVDGPLSAVVQNRGNRGLSNITSILCQSPESDHFIRAELDRECDFGALVMFYLENCREKCVVAEDATK